MKELSNLFPNEVAADGSKARISKSKVVRTPQSVYKAVAGCEAIRWAPTPPPHCLLPMLSFPGNDAQCLCVDGWHVVTHECRTVILVQGCGRPSND